MTRHLLVVTAAIFFAGTTARAETPGLGAHNGILAGVIGRFAVINLCADHILLEQVRLPGEGVLDRKSLDDAFDLKVQLRHVDRIFDRVFTVQAEAGIT